MVDRMPPGSSGLQIGRMGVRLPSASPDVGNRLAAQLQQTLATCDFGPARHLPRVDLRVTVPRGATPELVAEAIGRALRRRLGG